MKITLRELFLLILIAALALGWWLDRTQIQREYVRTIGAVPRDFVTAIELASSAGQPTSYRLIGCEYDFAGHYIVHMGFRNRHGRGGGSYTTIQKVDGKWKAEPVTKQYDVPPS